VGFVRSVVIITQSKTKLTLAVSKSDSQSLRLRLALANIGRRIPNPRPVATDVRGKFHIWNNIVVCADLERLVSSHNQSRLAILLVLQQPDIASTPLFPFPALAVKLEQLSSHLEDTLFQFLVCLGLDLLCEVDNWLEMDVWLSGFGVFILQGHSMSACHAY
jgi:hypothetical protein